MTDTLPWHHVHVTSPDREASAQWLEKHLPVKLIAPTPRSTQLVDGPNLLQIQSEKVASEPFGTASLHSLGVTVISLGTTLEKWSNGGGKVLKIDDDRKLAIVEDPHGLKLELVQAAADASREGFTHINIVAANPELLISWYSTTFGGKVAQCAWDASKVTVTYDTMQLVFAHMEETQAGSSSSTTAKTPAKFRPIDHLGWFAEDISTAHSRMIANGVKFPVPPRQFGQVKIAFLRDPCGLWIELCELPGNVVRKAKPISRL